MTSFALLLLRAVTGGFLAGHGAQKLFGAFGGRGPEGTARNFEKIGIEPAREWAEIAGATELTGGALTALGLLSPAGPVVSIAPMIVAWRKQHGDKPIWVNQGGAELPATNIAIASALALAGPGALSFDRLFGVRMPWWLSCLVIAATALGVVIALEDDIRETADEIRHEEALRSAEALERIPTA